MILWISKINWLKVFITGFIYTIIATIVHQIEAILTMKYYLMPQYFGLWSKLMMPVAGPPPIEFFITSFILTLVTGISITIIYYYLKDKLPIGFWKRAFFFADLMVATSFVFFTLPIYLLFNVPTMLLVYWFFSTFIIQVSTAIVLVKIIK